MSYIYDKIRKNFDARVDICDARVDICQNIYRKTLKEIIKCNKYFPKYCPFLESIFKYYLEIIYFVYKNSQTWIKCKEL